MFELDWWLAALAIFLGCGVQTALGFGMAVVAAPIIVVLKPEWVPVTLTVTVLSLSIANTWSTRQAIEWKTIWPAFITRIPGTMIGAWILTIVSLSTLQATVATFVLASIVITAWVKPFQATPNRLGLAGFASGLLGTTTSIGGPPMALILQHGESNSIRANLAAYFTYSSCLSLASYYFVGILDLPLLVESLSFLPFMILGFFGGKALQQWTDQTYRPLILTICAASASIALYSAFT